MDSSTRTTALMTAAVLSPILVLLVRHLTRPDPAQSPRTAGKPKMKRSRSATNAISGWMRLQGRVDNDGVDVDDEHSEEWKKTSHQAAIPHPVQGGPHQLMNGNRHNLVLVLVGLPGRGKTQVSHIVSRYLQFFQGFEVEIYNVSEYRRKKFHEIHKDLSSPEIRAQRAIDFFDPKNDEGARVLFQVNQQAMADMLRFVNTGDRRVAVFDAPNVTRRRRKWVQDCLQALNIRVVFVEMVSTEPILVAEHIAKSEIEALGLDGFEESLNEGYKRRISHYQSVYEPLDTTTDADLPFVKILEFGKQFVVNTIEGYVQSKIVHLLMNCSHHSQKAIYFTRHGQSEFNVQKRIGGDPVLTEQGEQFAEALAVFARERICRAEDGTEIPARLWTSTLRRTKLTTRHIEHPIIATPSGQVWTQMEHREWHNLDEIYAGLCDGMTYGEIEKQFPLEARERKKDKLTYRYPRGESYLDVIQRLEPLIQDMERHKEPLLICSHQGVLRMIYSFYTGMSREAATNVDIKQNHVYKLTPSPYGCKVEVFDLLHVDLKPDGLEHM